ncbi:hypothetical protein OV203_01355 [Nannocystis sp. ILAH1]|uniref:hypothetical protein n=1 Tax=Nannocystis sp. ILAH1 TaxID=2996789 RepID=UPI00226F207F|nr:hypothetical protein [Nannocystis sp. ILAH1]MCY0985757.1 hypothetical protein [Nannocystis sp. ILAH1]
MSRSLASRAYFMRTADLLEAAAPTLVSLVGYGRRFDALYQVARAALGCCPGCSAWPGQPHDPLGAVDDGAACVDGLFRGEATEHEFAAIAAIAATFDDLAASYCTSRVRPLRAHELAVLFEAAVSRLRVEADSPTTEPTPECERTEP